MSAHCVEQVCSIFGLWHIQIYLQISKEQSIPYHSCEDLIIPHNLPS